MSGGDTIAAVSTAPGEGGIGIVRLSGEQAVPIMRRLFVPWPGELTDRTMYYGHIIEPASGERVDEVLFVFMRGPRSYTGEDVCEIQCHGGGVPLRRILGIVCACGAVPAQAGEFTKRAFLNGRLDLAQAGAVIDLIRSKTERGYQAAREQADGRLSAVVRGARELLLSVLAEIAVRIDYPEEFEGAAPTDAGGALEHVGEIVEELLCEYEAGRIVRDGVRVVIVGKPNVGKSSLFNALAREDAAIVTAAPGTTRDALEAWLDVRGVPVLLVDTAGMREGDGLDEVERLGIERAREQYERADVCLFVVDGSVPLSEEDFDIARGLDAEKRCVVVVNKKDLGLAIGVDDAMRLIGGSVELDCFGKERLAMTAGKECFAMTACPSDIKEVEAALAEVVLGGVSAGGSLLVTKARHKVLLEAAAGDIGKARRALEAGVAAEFFEVNIRAAYESLGEIIGEQVADDVIDRVFEEFCVGK